MKLAVDCECILMQKALELFLRDYIVPESEANFIVSDEERDETKHNFLIGNYLNTPFTKEMLLEALEEYNFVISHKLIHKKSESIEAKISALFDDFKLKLVNTIKDHYE